VIPTAPERYKNLSCKVCNGKTSIFGYTDINKTCEEARNKIVISYIGHPICYHICNNCNFIFTVDFDDWDKKDFLEHIYNDDYTLTDPDYVGVRSIENANWLCSGLANLINNSMQLLDYGAGDNQLCKELNRRGYNTIGWDPMWDTKPEFSASETFDVVTAFEVLEHTPNPLKTIKEIAKFVKPITGIVVFSTLINEVVKPEERCNHWYLAPRNGHVCMHSLSSLKLMFELVGMQVTTINASQHIATRVEKIHV